MHHRRRSRRFSGGGGGRRDQFRGGHGPFGWRAGAQSWLGGPHTYLKLQKPAVILHEHQDFQCLAVTSHAYKVKAGDYIVYKLLIVRGDKKQVAAACCGVYGVRPSQGAVPSDGVSMASGRLEQVAWAAADAEVLCKVGQAMNLPGGAMPYLPNPSGRLITTTYSFLCLVSCAWYKGVVMKQQVLAARPAQCMNMSSMTIQRTDRRAFTLDGVMRALAAPQAARRRAPSWCAS